MEELLEAILDFILKVQGDADLAAAFDADPEAVLEAEGLGDVSAEQMHHLMPVILDLLSPKDSFNTEIETEIETEIDNSTNDSFNDTLTATDSFNPWTASQSLVDSPISSSAGGAGAGLLGGGSPAEILNSVVNNYVLNLNQSPVIQLWSGDADELSEVEGLGGRGGAGTTVELDFENNIVLGDNNAFATKGGEAYVVQTGENHVGHVAIDGDVDDRDVQADGSQFAMYGGEVDDEDINVEGVAGHVAFNGGEIDDEDIDASGNTGQQAFNGGSIENNTAGDSLATRGGEVEDNEAGENLATRGAEIDDAEVTAGDDAATKGGEIDNEVDNSVDNSVEADRGGQVGDSWEAEEGGQIGDNTATDSFNYESEFEVEVDVDVEDVQVETGPGDQAGDDIEGLQLDFPV